ncbi:squalene/phytoene synthase family protein [Streptomyces sp. ET3-23]|uniref:phytoene/squalene synthase family protein n=1 Tax=Streptomyces sp. ET3-23 TaxID=2885643 RepID=UPI001D10FC1A|nr:squalene/phytoene synthase family protein [Streptomyces sp. ET3-23]MCC2275858.1 squalene/phytoene synthase family protein [Streptomyces sp. ET3-23]
MTSWDTMLDAAGIHDPQLRADFTRGRVLVAGYRRQAYLAVRLLLPPALVPHVVAATAFMHHTDRLLDEARPLAERMAGHAEWEKQVREGLATGSAGHPILRPLLHTAAQYPVLRGHIEDFLAAAPADLSFKGFATEEDYAHYVDSYSLPAFMLIASLLAPDDRTDAFREACRSYIDGSQRLDFVNDLAEDLRDERLGLSEETLREHGVARTDLEDGRDTPGVRALLARHLGSAREDLAAARRMAGFVAPVHRPFVHAAVRIELLTADAVAAKGAGILRGPARPSVPAALAVLVGEYRRTRRVRQAA